MDTENGGAVADDMCCPRKETQLTPQAERVSKQKLSEKLSKILLRIVEKLEKEEQPQPSDDFTARQANQDIDNYFDSLNKKQQVNNVRSLSAQDAQQDLKDFFKVLKKGDIDGLLPEPQEAAAPQVPQPGDEEIIHKVASNVASKLVRSQESASIRRQREQFQEWKLRSEGDGEVMDDVMGDLAKEEQKQRQVAEQEGEKTAEAWAGRREHFYTDVHGKVPPSFVKNWGLQEHETVTVPVDNVQSR
jgi:hypothetical protein